MTVRATVPINGGVHSVWTKTLVTFTGTRFLHDTSCSKLSGQEQLSQPEDGLVFPEDELEPSLAVILMMQGRAPETMTVPQFRRVLQTCRYFMADALPLGFQNYVEGAADELTNDEVCAPLATTKI